MSGLLGGASSSAQMIHDPRRLRLKRLIRRIHCTNTYVLTHDSIWVELFCTRLDNRPLGQPHPSSARPCPSSTTRSTTLPSTRMGTAA